MQHLLHLLVAGGQVTPESGVALVDETAKTIERGGLYAIISVLLAGFVFLLWLHLKQVANKDKQLEGLHDLVIKMVEKQTAVLTEANLNSRNIEKHLEKLSALLAAKGAP